MTKQIDSNFDQEKGKNRLRENSRNFANDNLKYVWRRKNDPDTNSSKNNCLDAQPQQIQTCE